MELKHLRNALFRYASRISLSVSTIAFFCLIGSALIEKQKKWEKTRVKLSEVQSYNRIRKNKPEDVVTLTYSYAVKGVNYKFYDYRIFNEGQLSDSIISDIKAKENTATLYYNRNNPDEATLNISSYYKHLPQLRNNTLLFLFFAVISFLYIRREYRTIKSESP